MTPPTCRDCGAKLDTYTPTGDDRATPTAGAVSICAYCACISVFTGDGLALRAPTPAEIAEVEGDSRIRDVVRAIRSRRNPLYGRGVRP